MPDFDSSLKIEYQNKDSEHPTFVLLQERGNVDNLSLLHAGESIGRRTIVMANKDAKHRNVVIKEQYIEEGHRFKEENILKKIHENGRFPGVVSLVPDSPSSTTDIFVTHKASETSKSITRNKTRIMLTERGRSLLSGTTPREMLMVLFDALEGKSELIIDAL